MQIGSLKIGDAQSPSAHELETHKLGKRLLWIFAIAIAFTGVMALRETNCDSGECSQDPFWTDLFKTGFLLIGGAFTTVVGYYFGNAGADDARRQADIATQAARDAEQHANQMVQEANEIGNGIAPTDSEVSSGIRDAVIGVDGEDQN